MGEIRAGGHVIGEHGWVPASLVEEPASPVSMSNNKAELLAAAEIAGVEADESMTKAEILEALEG
jgi:hypothetical protein